MLWDVLDRRVTFDLENKGVTRTASHRVVEQNSAGLSKNRALLHRALRLNVFVGDLELVPLGDERCGTCTVGLRAAELVGLEAPAISTTCVAAAS